MIIEKKGDLLEEKKCIIAHQVNCRGVMGAGVALQIKTKLLSDENFLSYKNLCLTKPASELLGHVQLCKTPVGIIIANLFGEDIPTGNSLDTDYDALRSALINLRAYALKDFGHYMGSLDNAVHICEARQKAALILRDIAPEEFDDNVSSEENEMYADLQNFKESSDRLFHEFSFKEIAIPKYMGCGLAGGDWNTVFQIIKELFDEFPVNIRIVEFSN